MIRYRTGDVTSAHDRARAAAAGPRRASRASRAGPTTCSIIKGVNLYPSEVEATLLAVEELQPHYQLVVDRASTLARLEVQVEPTPALLARCGGFAARPSRAGRAPPARRPSVCTAPRA